MREYPLVTDIGEPVTISSTLVEDPELSFASNAAPVCVVTLEDGTRCVCIGEARPLRELDEELPHLDGDRQLTEDVPRDPAEWIAENLVRGCRVTVTGRPATVRATPAWDELVDEGYFPTRMLLIDRFTQDDGCTWAQDNGAASPWLQNHHLAHSSAASLRWRFISSGGSRRLGGAGVDGGLAARVARGRARGATRVERLPSTRERRRPGTLSKADRVRGRVYANLSSWTASPWGLSPSSQAMGLRSIRWARNSLLFPGRPRLANSHRADPCPSRSLQVSAAVSRRWHVSRRPWGGGRPPGFLAERPAWCLRQR